MAKFYIRLQRQDDDSLSERPRKISRPSTGGPSSSSSSSALWRTGSTPRADRQEVNASSDSGGAQYNNSAQPVGLQGRVQQRPVTANGRGENPQSRGLSLSSLLNGGNAGSSMDDRNIGGMSSQYQQSAGSFGPQQQRQQQEQPQQQRQQQQQPQRQQQQDEGQCIRAGNRQPFNIPSQTGNPQSLRSQAPNVTPPSLSSGSGTGSSNAGAIGRPLTPSTLFVQNAQQSQYFPRQQQVVLIPFHPEFLIRF